MGTFTVFVNVSEVFHEKDDLELDFNPVRKFYDSIQLTPQKNKFRITFKKINEEIQYYEIEDADHFFDENEYLILNLIKNHKIVRRIKLKRGERFRSQSLVFHWNTILTGINTQVKLMVMVYFRIFE